MRLSIFLRLCCDNYTQIMVVHVWSKNHTWHNQRSIFNLICSHCFITVNLIDSHVFFTFELDLTICNTGSVNILIPIWSLHSSVSETTYCYHLSFWSNKMQNKPRIKCSFGTISPSQTVVACMNPNSMLTFFHWLCDSTGYSTWAFTDLWGSSLWQSYPCPYLAVLACMNAISMLTFSLLIVFDVTGYSSRVFTNLSSLPWWHPWGSSLWYCPCPCPYLFCSSAVLECRLRCFNGLVP